MKNLFRTPASVAVAETVSSVKRAPRIVERATIVGNDLTYMANDAERYDVLLATKNADAALWPAIASIFADGAPTFDTAATGDAKARARICAKAARTAILAQYNKLANTGDGYVPLTSLPGSSETYIGELSRGRMYGISPVTTSGPNGEPLTLMGWTVFQASVREAVGNKVPESADACLVRLVKAFDTHKGSRVTSGIVTADALLPLLTAFADAVSIKALREMIDKVPAARQKNGTLHVAQIPNAPDAKAQTKAQRKAAKELAEAHAQDRAAVDLDAQLRAAADARVTVAGAELVQ